MDFTHAISTNYFDQATFVSNIFFSYLFVFIQKFHKYVGPYRILLVYGHMVSMRILRIVFYLLCVCVVFVSRMCPLRNPLVENIPLKYE